MYEVGAVASGDGCIGRAGDGGDLAIGLQDGPAHGPTRGGDGRIGPGRGAVEGQYPSCKILPNHGIDLGGEAVATPARWQYRSASAQLRSLTAVR